MPSASLLRWRSDRIAELDEIEAAHRAVGGQGRGRRYATQQINHAYVVLLSSQFQGFCRDLHTECVDIVTQAVSPASLRPLLEEGLLRDRKLDRGNPNPGNIGADFGRLGISLWHQVYTASVQNHQRRQILEDLNVWRNAIAHQDFSSVGSAAIQLQRVRRWRSACDALARAFDFALKAHITNQIGVSPWS